MALGTQAPKSTSVSGTRVLVVEDDEARRNALASDLASHGYEVGVAIGQDGAINALRNGRFDIVLADYEPGTRVGVDLVEALSSLTIPPRPVLIRRQGSEGVTPAPNGASVLQMPYQSEDLLRVVAEAAATASGFDAHLSGVNLIDMLQLLHFSQRTATVQVDGAQSGRVYFERGEIVHATLDQETGIHVLPKLLRVTSGAIRMESVRTSERTIQAPFQMLLLDLLRQEDERNTQTEEFDVDDAFASYRAPSPTARAPLLSIASSPPLEAVAEISGACARVVADSDGIVECAVVDPLTRWIIGQNSTHGRSLQTDHLAMGVVDLVGQAVRHRAKNAEGAPLDGQVTSPELMYLSRTFNSCRAVLLIVTTRSTSVGLARAQLGMAISALDAVVLAAFEQGSVGWVE